MLNKHLFKIVWLTLIMALTMMIFVPYTSVLAANTSQASYYAVIRISNNGTTAAYNVSVPLTLNTSYLVNYGYFASNLSNTAMNDNLGNSTYYNPAVVTNTTWMIFVPSIPADSSIDYSLYMGGNLDMVGNISWMPGVNGGSTPDSASLELGSNFSITQYGYLDTIHYKNRNLTAKSGAIVLNTTANGSITASLNGSRANLSSDDGTAYGLDADEFKRVGQKFTTLPNVILKSVVFRLSKTGSPTGTLSVCVRNVSDDALIGNISTLNVATLTATPTNYTFTGTLAISNPAVRICAEYSGGDNSNYVYVYTSTTNPSGENASIYESSWAENANTDLVYSLNTDSELTASNINSGRHLVSLTGNSTGLYLRVDNTMFSNSGFFIPAVTNTSSNWQFSGNNTWPALERQVITVNGTTVQDISWQNAAIWVDASGYGNNLTPTFRSTTTNANVSAVLIDMRADNEAILTDWDLNDYTNNLDIPDMPGGMYEDVNPTFPGHDIPGDVASSTGGAVHVNMFWFIIPCAIGVGMGLLVHDKTKSLFVQSLVIVLFVLFLSLIHVWSFWVLIPIVTICLTALLASKIFNY